MAERSDFTLGEIVYFGRNRGEKTKGEIIKLNPKRAKVKQLEERGTTRSHQVGTEWTVPYSLIYKCDDQDKPEPPKEEPLVFSPFQDSVDQYVLLAINACYAGLSPENLTCDGEAPAHMVRRTRQELTHKLQCLQGTLGRLVSEEAAYEWQEAYDAHHQGRSNVG